MNDLDLLETLVRQWSRDKQLDKADPIVQMSKGMEELGETASALLRRNKAKTPEDLKKVMEKVKDGIGDVVVVMIILAQQLGLTLTECLNYSWEQIKTRNGQTINGVFIKDSDLNKIENGENK